MIIATLLPTFPGCPTFGFTSQPDYLVKIVQREGGFERRDRKWAQALHRYDGAPLGPRPQRDIEDILRFWHAIGGQSTKFRFKDWGDYKSCLLDNDVTAIDQPLEFAPGSPGGYQLVKQYIEGSLIQERTIRYPKGDTIVVANEVGAEQAASTWVIEEDTGLVVPGVGFVGTPTSWGGEFYVPCRFDGPFKIELSDYKVQNLQVSIVEIREAAL